MLWLSILSPVAGSIVPSTHECAGSRELPRGKWKKALLDFAGLRRPAFYSRL
jgi:hypothetical protein